jgi:anti-sigma factor RsiW
MIQDHQHLSYEEVSALVDGELVSRDAHDLEQHLASCAGRWSAQLSLPN